MIKVHDIEPTFVFSGENPNIEVYFLSIYATRVILMTGNAVPNSFEIGHTWKYWAIKLPENFVNWSYRKK